MKKGMVLLLAGILAGFSAGCASRSAYVTTRRNADVPLDRAGTVAIAPHDQPIPEEEGLNRSLARVLEQTGFHVVTNADANYTLAYWVEDNWHEHTLPPQAYTSRLNQNNYITAANGAQVRQMGPSGLQDFADQSVNQRIRDQYTNTRGIRLKLYRTQDLQAGRFDTLWEGFIDAGDEVRAGQQELLLKTLFRYLGKDFDGRVKFSE